jgi:hypothetical protein
MVACVPVLMEGRVIQMESAFVKWDFKDRRVKHVEFVSLCKYKLSSIILLFRYWL